MTLPFLVVAVLLLLGCSAAPGLDHIDNVTCCVPWPIEGNETKLGCEAGGDAMHDGGTYHFNSGRGTPEAVCGEHLNCQCCRTGPRSSACDAPWAPVDSNTVVFPHGQIPSMAYVPPGAPGAHETNGTLLAFMEPLHVVRSTDHGTTWTAPTVPGDPANSADPASPGPKSHWCCPQSLFDPVSKTVYLQFGNSTSMKGGCDIGEEQLGGVRQLQSTDAGATWGSYVNVQTQLRAATPPVPVPSNGTCLNPTSGQGLVMRPVDGKFGGRLVFCAVRNAYEGDIPVFSDDGGKTYRFSTGVYKPGMDECNIAQATNGSLLLIARNCWNGNLRTCQMRRQLVENSAKVDGPGSHTFAISMSNDGGETWGPITHQPQLVTPVCQASIISYKGPQDQDPVLYYSHPYSTTSRKNGTILASDDNGLTFSRALNLGIPTTFGYTGLACGLVGSQQDCAVMYDAGGVLRLKLFKSSDVK